MVSHLSECASDLAPTGQTFASRGSTEDMSRLMCGDVQPSKLADLMNDEDDEVMEAAELLKCLQEMDSDLPSPPRWQPVQSDLKLIRPPHCRREAVVCVVSLRTVSTFCYAVVSRLGRVGVYDANFVLLDSYSLELGFVHPHAKIGIGREGDTREPLQHSTRVNDAVFLPDAQVLIVAASDRSLTILDASRLLHTRRGEIRSLPAAPQCLAYSAGASGAPSRLFIGDDCGGVATLAFRRPRQALLRPPGAEDKRVSFFWKELHQQPEWLCILEEAKVHGDMVCRLAYSEDNDTLTSCSRDHRATLVLRHLGGRRRPYVFSVPRGASCFVLDRSLMVLVTGGRDAVVRLWNPLVPSQPQALLRGHAAPVLDLAVLALWELVLSIDRRGVLKVWHLAEQTCLQTVELPFTALGVPGRKIESGIRTLYPGPPCSSKTRGGAETLVAVLCGELVLLRVLGARASSTASTNELEQLLPPRREQSPAVPESWSPSLLEPSSDDRSSVSSGRDGRSSLDSTSFDLQGRGFDVTPGSSTPEDCDPDELPFPKSQSPLLESIEDWPVPDDSLFKEDEPTMKTPSMASSKTLAPQPVSHRPVPDEDGLYPEEVASLRALGLRPLDLESIGVNLGAAASGDGGTISLLPMDTLAVVRQAHALQKKSHKQMRTLAWHCVPHLALKLPEETAVSFSRPLPVSSRMRARCIDVSDPERLMQAKLKPPPAPATAGARLLTRTLQPHGNASSFKLSSASAPASTAGSANTS